MSIGLVELVTRIGDQNIEFQNLRQVADGARRGKGGVCKYTFGSAVPMEQVLLDNPTKIGLILWLDKATVDRIMSEDKS